MWAVMVSEGLLHHGQAGGCPVQLAHIRQRGLLALQLARQPLYVRQPCTPDHVRTLTPANTVYAPFPRLSNECLMASLCMPPLQQVDITKETACLALCHLRATS